MRSLPHAVWQYATFLILLFVIASVAAWTTISDLYSIATLVPVDSEELRHTLDVITFKIWAQTMGFLLISGAFGLWTIKFSSEFESRKRVANIVEGMDNMNDGLLLLDKNGQVMATNPSLKSVASVDRLKLTSLAGIFPFLTPEEISLLLRTSGPNEVQKDTIGPAGKQTLRFRSQNAGSSLLLFVSDVTTLRVLELQKQHLTRVELIGRIARGVTNDFNNILSGISAHASLLLRLPPGGTETKTSTNAIIREAERGALLAGHLLEFSRLSVTGNSTDNLGVHVSRAGELLQMGLSSGWQVETEVRTDFPAVPLSGQQIEQVLLNLSLSLADIAERPGTIRIVAGRPSQADYLMNIGDQFAAVVLISVMGADTDGAGNLDPERDHSPSDDQSGVIQSVARSLIEESGGSLDFFRGAEGPGIYRIILPYGNIEIPTEMAEDKLSLELRSYVSRWQVLLARSTRGNDHLAEALKDAGVTVERTDSVVSALARVESTATLHAIVFDRDLLGNEAHGLLRAMIKLCPQTGIVVLCEDPDREVSNLIKDIVFVQKRTDPGRIIVAMIEAKTLAAQRRHRS
ncbi:MAG: hypothetical protein WCL44_08560 [bacterium]